jgi:hypothetical protein
MKWLLPSFGSLCAIVALALWYLEKRWNAATYRMTTRLRQAGRPTTRTFYSASELAGLPAPVIRYFRTVLSDGQPIITHAHVRWSGEFKMGRPGRDKWVPFTAEQDFAPGAPGMVWDARMTMAAGLTVRVRDAFVDGRGSMFGAVLGIVPVVNGRDTPSMAVASLQRYLAEAPWFPTALLPSQGVRWVAVDDSTARATLGTGSIVTSVEFRFGADGSIASVFVPDRLYDDGRSEPARRPWLGRNLSYERRHGMLVPGEAIAEWLLPQGPYGYWRARPTLLDYESGPKQT